MVDATGIPEDAFGAGAWDVPGGLPDPFLRFYVVGGGNWRTSTRLNTLRPVWNEFVEPLRINESTRVRWELWDEDVADHDGILGIWDDADAHAISVDRIRAGGWTEGGAGITITFEIEPM